MMILAIDTALAAASVCLFEAGAPEPLAADRLPLVRGHDAALMPMIARIVGPEGFARIDRVAVTVGPGSFTGLRIGIAAAQGIGLARKIPVVGVSTLAAFAADAVAQGGDQPIVAAVDARHGRVFLEIFTANGRSLRPPALTPIGDVVTFMRGRTVRLVGSAAPMLAIEAWQSGIAATVAGDTTAPNIAFVARLGLLADPASAPPRPLYLKDADVTVSAAPRPVAPTR